MGAIDGNTRTGKKRNLVTHDLKILLLLPPPRFTHIPLRRARIGFRDSIAEAKTGGDWKIL